MTTITSFRITKRRFSETIWSGIGARDYGGRWNSKGIAVVYTAENRSLAALEQLVHLVRPRVLPGYLIASITFPADAVQRIEAASLPKGWNRPVAPAALRRNGDDWVAARTSPVLAVPSAIVPGEWNYLINPEHPGFRRMHKSAPVRFV